MKRIISLFVLAGLLACAVGSLVLPFSSAQVAADTTVNNVAVNFHTAWKYESPEDTFINSQVTGSKWWQADLMNSPDETEAPITALSLNLESTMAFDILKIEKLVKSGPPTYEWSFSDIPEHSSVDVWVDEFLADGSYAGGQWLGGTFANFIGNRYLDFTPGAGSNSIMISIYTPEGSQLKGFIDDVKFRLVN